MLDAIRLIHALKIVFRRETEFFPESFAELTPKQEEVWQRKHGKSPERIYRVVPFEPTVIERTEEKVTLELEVVTESERKLLLDAVRFVYIATREMPEKNPSFCERLAYLRPKLPPIVTSDHE
jgi:hypothetical protein